MTLLLALLALASYFALPPDWRRMAGHPADVWLEWCDQLPEKLSPGIRLALSLLIPMVVLAVLLKALHELGLAPLVFVPTALVLMGIFGDVTLPDAATRHLGGTPSGAAASADDEQQDWVTPEVELSGTLAQARAELLRESLHELFSPLFWFLLATPVAALGYYILRMAAYEGSEDTRRLASHWLTLADWIPTRLLALSFALAGNFTATWGVIRERLLKPDAEGHELIDEAASAAEPTDLDGASPQIILSEALTGLQALLQRALIVWMVMLALHTLWPGT